MRIGLLVADHLDPEVRDTVGGDYGDLLFPGLLAPLGAEIELFDAVGGDLPASLDACDVYCTTGSRRSAYEPEPWIEELGEFLGAVATAKRPLVAVCFGHQLLAQALGGRVEKASGWGVGYRHFELLERPWWWDDAPDGFDVLTSHQDQVVELPDGAVRLAAADYCPNGAYVIGRHILAIQGHPEFVPSLSRELMERRRAIIAPETIEVGLASLDSGRSNTVVRDLVRRFIEAQPTPQSAP